MNEPPVDPNAPPVVEPPKVDEPVAFIPLTAENLTFPEGFTVNEPLRDEFLALVNNQELSASDRANGLIGLQEKVLAAASEANSEAWNTMQSDWQKEVKADPEIGGAKFDATMTNIGKLVEEFGTPELRQAFDVTGAGNNPHVIRFLNTLAGKLTEGSTAAPGLPTNSGDAASRLFPSMKG